jgi:hypothetical protein
MENLMGYERHFFFAKEGEKRVWIRTISRLPDKSQPPLLRYLILVSVEESPGTWQEVKHYGPGSWQWEIEPKMKELVNLYRADGWIRVEE